MEPISRIKRNLRLSLRKQRRELSISKKIKKAIELMNVIIELPEFIHSQHIAAYWAHDGEIDPLPLLDKALSLGKICYLPVIHPNDPLILGFVKYCPGDYLIPNRYGILEPKFNLSDVILSQNLDLLLLPVVAFDKAGRRLGMGGGHYDRTLSYFQHTIKPIKPHLLGIAYELQYSLSIPSEPWDIPLKGIVTEKRYIVANKIRTT